MQEYICNRPATDTPRPPIYFHTASSSFRQSTMRYAAGAQDFYQILLVIAGTGVLHHNSQTYSLRRGCAFFTAQGVPSSYINTGGLQTAFLTAKGEAVPALIKHLHCGDFFYTDKADTDKLLSAIRQIIREYHSCKRQGILSAYTYSFFINFFEEHTLSQETPVQQIHAYIQHNFSQKLHLEALAERYGISISKLCHDFKKEYGCTVFSCVLDLRLNHARDFLRVFRDRPVKDAAHSSGFEDLSYFCKAYKKKYGNSPAADRRAVG